MFFAAKACPKIKIFFMPQPPTFLGFAIFYQLDR